MGFKAGTLVRARNVFEAPIGVIVGESNLVIDGQEMAAYLYDGNYTADRVMALEPVTTHTQLPMDWKRVLVYIVSQGNNDIRPRYDVTELSSAVARQHHRWVTDEIAKRYWNAIFDLSRLTALLEWDDWSEEAGGVTVVRLTEAANPLVKSIVKAYS